jgi:hypothetical protein
MSKRGEGSKTPRPEDFDRALDAALSAEEAVNPCDECRFLTRCRDESLACDRFALFRAGFNKARIAIAPRVPSRARFEALTAIDRRPKRQPRPAVESLWEEDVEW